jgi:hypothetical protein
LAIALLALTVLLRFIAPHDFLEALSGRPLVPAATGLTLLGALYAILRKQAKPGITPQIVVQWGVLVWIAISLVVNEGGGVVRLLSSNFLKDVFFITVAVLIVDNVKRLKIFLLAIVASFVFIGFFGLPQLTGPKQCAEWKEGDMANLIFDGRPCDVTANCFVNQPKVRLIPGIGPRLYRCEHRGPFGIAAYVGRLRWVGNFQDVNNLGSMVALMIPMLILWGRHLREAAGEAQRWRKLRWLARWIVLPGIALLFAAMVVGTGSRGSQLGMLIGSGLAMWKLWGKKVVLIGAAGVIAVAAVVISTGKLTIRNEASFEASTKVSDRYRTDAMMTGYRLWKEFPIFGVGYQNFEQHHLIDPHNAFLCSLGEMGTVGLFLFAFGMWMNFKAVLMARRKAREAGRRDLDYLLTGVACGMTGGTMSLTLFLSTYAALNWLVIVLIGSATYRAAQSELPELRLGISPWDIGGAILSSLLVVGVIYLGLAIYYT